MRLTGNTGVMCSLDCELLGSGFGNASVLPHLWHGGCHVRCAADWGDGAHHGEIRAGGVSSHNAPRTNIVCTYCATDCAVHGEASGCKTRAVFSIEDGVQRYVSWCSSALRLGHTMQTQLAQMPYIFGPPSQHNLVTFFCCYLCHCFRSCAVG